MAAKTKLERLREDNCFLTDLPDTIRIPPLGDRQEEVIKPIEAASIDDIAFAQLALQAKSSALSMPKSMRCVGSTTWPARMAPWVQTLPWMRLHRRRGVSDAAPHYFRR